VGDKRSKSPSTAPPVDIGITLDGRGKVATIVSFVIPALLVVGLLFLLIAARTGAESALAQLAYLLPMGYAFSAGMVASVNPCGFLLLPSYIMYHLGAGEGDFYEQHIGRRLFKALYLGTVATLGFVVVFALTGLVVAAGGRWLNVVFPHARAVIGVGMSVLGLWLLVTRRSLGLKAASRVTITPRRSLGNVFLFGIVYAIGSLSCTLPIFLVVVGSALSSQAWIGALGHFIGYALGMASVFVAVTVGAALVRQVMTKRLRGAVLYVSRFSALLLVGVGIYLVYDWLSQMWIVV
jgi:cytochrome c biogenesis protein CcdA